MSTAPVLRRVAYELGQEIALYRSLARWLTRRRDVPAGATAIGYSQLSAPMMWLWIFGSAVEVVVAEVVLRSIGAGWADLVRLPVLLLGIWGLLWMLGQLAASQVRPHLLTSDSLRIRNGTRAWVDVPRESIAHARATEHEYEGVMKTLHHHDDLLLVGVNVRTNVELELQDVTTVETSQGARSALRIGFWADDPRSTASLLKPHQFSRRESGRA